MDSNKSKMPQQRKKLQTPVLIEHHVKEKKDEKSKTARVAESSCSNSTYQETTSQTNPGRIIDVIDLTETWSEENHNTFKQQNFTEEITIMEEDSSSSEEEAMDQNAADVADKGSVKSESSADSTEEQVEQIRYRDRFNKPFEEHKQNEDRKCRLSSPSGQNAFRGNRPALKYVKPNDDDEPSFNEADVLLSWYDSDLNLAIGKENFLTAVPLHDRGFMYMWAGARSTYGFHSGKVYYDVKLTEKLSVDVVDEIEVHSFRLGWSASFTSLQLGEVPLSYGYDSRGKKCENNNFEDYGQPFNAGDIIGCLVDFDSNEEKVLISYTVNGADQGVAFEVAKERLQMKILYPHILTKNINFEVNFGERKNDWKLEIEFEGDFEWASKVPIENRVRGLRKPGQKEQCEVVMMWGLPCSGKTTWVREHLRHNPEVMYNVIGIDNVLQKMKVLNEPIEKQFKEKGKMNMLLEICLKCVNRLKEIACTRWRYYILDQCHTFMGQRKKMRDFEGFTRIAVVILPKEEEYEKYLGKWNENAVRETAIPILGFKCYSTLPTESDELFERITFRGTTREEAEKLIKKYNKEGRDARQRNPYYGRYARRMGGGSRFGPPRDGMYGMGPGRFPNRRNWNRSVLLPTYRGAQHGGRYMYGNRPNWRRQLANRNQQYQQWVQYQQAVGYNPQQLLQFTAQMILDLQE